MSKSAIKRLLLVEDNPGDARLLREMLSEPGAPRFDLAHVTSLSAAERHLADHDIDIVLLDLGLPDAHGLTAVRWAHAAAPRVTLVVLSGLDDESMAVQALQEGAQDYLIKGQIDTRSLLRALRYAVERKISEDRYRSVLEHANDAILLFKPDFEILEANRRAEELLGCPREQIVGRSYESFTAPEDRALLAEDQARLLADGATRVRDRRLLRMDRGVVYVDVSASVMRNGHDTVVLAILHDTSERRRSEGELDAAKGRLHHGAEERLLESEEQYRLLFEANPQAMWVFDAETFAFLAVNAAAVQLYGFSRDELLGMTVKDIRSPEPPPVLEKYLAKRLEAAPGDAVEAQARHRKKDGSFFEVEGATSPIAFHGKRAHLAFARDVSEKKLLQAQLLQAQKLEAVGRLAGGIAHDFDNSLGVILGYTELLMRRADAAQQGKLEQVLKATKRASGLTRQLLAFSRKQVVDPRVLDLNFLLADLEIMLGRLIGENVVLAIVPGVHLGQVKVDPGQFEQVVMNLCLNARDAMPGGGRLRIETANVELDAAHAARHGLVAPGRYVMLAVSDTGSGIEKEILSTIFEPFFTTKEPGKGTGLGLAMAYGTVKQAGGNVRVDSEVGRGTTFTIYLPRIDEPAAAAEEEEARVPSKGSETILLVEGRLP